MVSLSRWLDVEVGTDEIDLNSLPSNLALVDLHSDNEFKLLVGDFGRENGDGPKLKVFKGASQVSDISLPDLPLSVVGFYCTETLPRSLPIVAVAYGFGIHMYRNMKLFYKYYLPTIELNTTEKEVWKQLTESKDLPSETLASLIDNLRSMPQKLLSPQTQHFLSLSNEHQSEYIEQLNEMPCRRSPEIVCLTTLKMSSVDRHAVSCLVLATEDGDIIILEPQTFTQLNCVKICEVQKTPHQIIATGLFHVDYRITVATREKCVCILKREWKEGKILFRTEGHIIAIEVMGIDNSILVICTDNTLSCYNRKGKKQWSSSLEHRPISMCLFPITHLGTVLVGVGFHSGHVHLYDGKALVDTMFIRDIATVMRFGQLGREEHVLTIITSTGNLMLKILKRTASFNIDATAIDSYAACSANQAARPWHIPKKSKLFLEQSMRERENAVAMHESFQMDLQRLRLTAAKTLLEAHQKSENTFGVGALEPLRLSAEIEGLGPVFRVVLIVENTSTQKAVMDLAILFHTPSVNYRVSNPYIKVPLLAPGGKLRFPTKVEERFDDDMNPDVLFRDITGDSGEGSLLKILLLKKEKIVLAATARLPATDPLMLPYDKMQSTAAFF